MNDPPFAAQASKLESQWREFRRPAARAAYHESVKEVTETLLPPNESLSDAMGDLDDVFCEIFREPFNDLLDEIALTSSRERLCIVIPDLPPDIQR